MHHARHHAAAPADRLELRCVRFRRMLGLFAFFYAMLHFTTYLWFDHCFDVAAMLKDIVKRPFITVGFAAFVLLIAAGRDVAERDGASSLGRRWQTAAPAIYVIAPLAILHFWWMKAGKHDLMLPKIYGAIVLALLGWRLIVWLMGVAQALTMRAREQRAYKKAMPRRHRFLIRRCAGSRPAESIRRRTTA